MNRTLVLGSILLALLAVAGCGEPDDGRDTGVDTGGTLDTGPIDGGGVGSDVPMTDTPSTTRVCSVGPSGCDIIRQDCAPEGGTARGCYLSGGATAETVCAPSGVGVEGTACTGLSDCAEGLGCQDGFCRQYCCMEMDSDCPIGFQCIPYRDPATTDGLLPVGVCDPPVTCEVIPNSGCPEGRACQPGMDGTLSCVTAGTAAVGADCGGSVNCMPGSGCYGTSADDLTCIAFCVIADPDCADGTTCTAQPAVVGGGYGLCTPNP